MFVRRVWQSTDLMNPESLTRFFQTLPLADKRETLAARDELMRRLPRRGVLPHPEVVRLRKMASNESICRRVGLEPPGLPSESPQERWDVQILRRDECAHFIQLHVLRWLYVPNGAMPRRLGWETCKMLDNAR